MGAGRVMGAGRTDSCRVSLQREQFLAARCVPDLYESFVRSHRHVIPLEHKDSVRRPRDKSREAAVRK